VRISIDGLPPIASGSFELRPLTIFIGRNNTGKTRAALLAHALARSLDQPFTSKAFPRRREPFIREGFDESQTPRNWQAVIQQDFSEHVATAISRTLPTVVTEFLGAQTTDPLKARAQVQYSGRLGATIKLTAEKLGWSVHTDLGEFHSATNQWERLVARANERSFDAMDRRTPPDEAFWTNLRREERFPSGRTYYLPAGRGVLADTWAFYASLALESVGRSRFSPELPAAIRDFLQSMLHASSRLAAAKAGDESIGLIVDELERSLLKGRVTAGGSASLPFPLIYSNIYDDDQRDAFTLIWL
jgi:hypothetical protein